MEGETLNVLNFRTHEFGPLLRSTLTILQRSTKMTSKFEKNEIKRCMKSCHQDVLVGEEPRKNGWLKNFHLRDVLALDVEKV
jgi:hypothetical protein